ncbi:peptidyl-prolyl cis-trans isomerase [Poriferisphaera sp. WC338]|uniref:peptidylprolyl isomerase n=1 Tax=Poriferisphaera sp. WC338 TaxID=3425129 RepID=UPI003D81B830
MIYTFRMTILEKTAPILAISAISLSLVGCAFFADKDTGPSAEDLTAIEQEYRERERERAQTLAANENVNPAESSLVINAMIGQINGNAIYADDVLAPLHEEFSTISRTATREDFYRRAIASVQQRVREIIDDTLLYGEAERSLNENEQYGLKMFINTRREELLRTYGQGSYSLADQKVHEEFGKSLEELLEDHRKKAVIQKHIDEELLSLISVSRRDVERYYRDHAEKYNPPVKRDVRMIRVATPELANEFQQKLADGESFIALASSESNTFMKFRKGQLKDLEGDEPLRKDLASLNESLQTLKEGEFTPEPIVIGKNYWFVYVEKFNQAQRKSLRDVQMEIQNELRHQQYLTRQNQYMMKLYQNGSFSDPVEMSKKLVQIVMNRYAAPES